MRKQHEGGKELENVFLWMGLEGLGKIRGEHGQELDAVWATWVKKNNVVFWEEVFKQQIKTAQQRTLSKWPSEQAQDAFEVTVIENLPVKTLSPINEWQVSKKVEVESGWSQLVMGASNVFSKDIQYCVRQRELLYQWLSEGVSSSHFQTAQELRLHYKNHLKFYFKAW